MAVYLKREMKKIFSLRLKSPLALPRSARGFVCGGVKRRVAAECDVSAEYIRTASVFFKKCHGYEKAPPVFNVLEQAWTNC